MKSDLTTKIVIIALSIFLCVAIYMWSTKSVIVVDSGSDRIEELKLENNDLKTLLSDTLEKQDLFYKSILDNKDSIIHAKVINNWNLIVNHEKELELYRSIPVDSAYVMWWVMSRTDRFNID